MRNNNGLGYIREFHQDKETKDWVAREDLTSEDKKTRDLVQSWIYGLAEPWSDSARFYSIHRNCVYDGAIVPENEAWVATYTSIFYDCLESVVVAYGSTPQEALSSAESLLAEMLQIYEEQYAEHDEDDGEE